MQYGANVSAYQRMKDEKNIKRISININLLNMIINILMGFMLSRINIQIVEGLILAPFGIAYLLTITNGKNISKVIVGTVSVFLGYLTVYSTESKSIIYLLVIGSIFLYYILNIKFEKLVNKRVKIAISLLVYTIVGVIIGEQGILVNLIFSLISAFSIIAVNFVITQGINCFSDIKKDYLFSTEELISMSLLICLTVAGIGNLSVFSVDIRNIIALGVVIAIAYAGGSAVGTILGVIMGTIVGITNNDIVGLVALYSISGLVVGIFSTINKIFAIISYFITCFIIISYSDGAITSSTFDIVAASVFLLLIPLELSKRIFKEVNNEEKKSRINTNQLDGVKNEFIERIDNLKGILITLSNALDSLSGNDNLLIKNKSFAMIDNLGDRVCNSCEMKDKCWEREFHNTFSSFEELIGNYQNNEFEIPKELSKKCVKINTLIKNVQNILVNHSVNEIARERLIEGRNLISAQINNISEAVNGIINDFDETIDDCYEIDNALKKALNKRKINFNEVYSYRDKTGRIKIKIKINNKNSENYYLKTILPIVGEFIKAPVEVVEDGFKINPITNECTIIMEEAARYRIESYAALQAKDGETCSGDSFSFGKNKKGLYVTAISDGMGSGPEANSESEATIKIIEKFIEYGFDENTAVNTINSIMGMRFDENEKFTTLDMNTIDLYDGEISFIKVGGVVSFIKKKNKVEVINSSTLPFGIVDSIEVDIKKDIVSNGDIIVIVSDGVVDMDKNNAGDYKWVKEYLENSTTNPEKLSRDILEEAKKRSFDKLKDDMTVVVSKVYSV